MSRTILQPVVGYGFDEATGEYRLNANEEKFANRVSRSRFWRDSLARAAFTPPPPPFVITAPAIAAGEEYETASELFQRLYKLQAAGHTTSYKVKGQP